jgi:hypothetical protein
LSLAAVYAAMTPAEVPPYTHISYDWENDFS